MTVEKEGEPAESLADAEQRIFKRLNQEIGVKAGSTKLRIRLTNGRVVEGTYSDVSYGSPPTSIFLSLVVNKKEDSTDKKSTENQTFEFRTIDTIEEYFPHYKPNPTNGVRTQ